MADRDTSSLFFGKVTVGSWPETILLSTTVAEKKLCLRRVDRLFIPSGKYTAILTHATSQSGPIFTLSALRCARIRVCIDHFPTTSYRIYHFRFVYDTGRIVRSYERPTPFPITKFTWCTPHIYLYQKLIFMQVSRTKSKKLQPLDMHSTNAFFKYPSILITLIRWMVLISDGYFIVWNNVNQSSSQIPFVFHKLLLSNQVLLGN